MSKNDINLIFKRKAKQYSTKSLLITIVIVAVLGVGVFFGITLPTRNLSSTKAAISKLDTQIQQYSALALSSGGTEMDAALPEDTSLETLLMVKSNKLHELDEQLAGLKLISTADSNALAYIRAIEESIPNEINVANLTMDNKTIDIVGVAADDTSLATFCLRLRETAMFNDVFVASTIVSAPGNKTSAFNITATLRESLDAMTQAQDATMEETDEGI